ncbi:MAG: BTAD domain-containing putative transcriptional regulator, partial [Anaerolineae bacterium]
AMGRLEEARDVLEEAVSTARRGGVRRTEGLVLASLGDVQSDLDEFAAAMDSYDVSLRRARDTGEGTMVCYCLASIAEAQRLAGELDSAHSYIAEARQELAANRSAFEAALVDYVRGTIALDRREYERAVEHLEDAARSFSKMSACREQARAMLYRVATSHRSGDMADADLHWSQAKSLMQKFGYRQAFEPQVRRLPEVFAREAIHDVTPPRGNGAEDAAAAVAVDQGEQPATGDGLGPGGGTAAPIELAVRAFGVPAVEVNGRPVGKGEWETAAAQELFFFLVDRPGGVGRDDVLLAFWPESTMPRATSAFHSTLHRVRQAVGKGTIGHQGERYFVPQGCLAAYDVAEFEACVAAAADVPDQEAVTLLSRAADLAAGDYLQGVSADWARDRGTGLRAAAVETAMRLGRLHLAASRPEAAAEAYERALELEPLEEEAHRSLMLVLAKAGHRTKALQQYDRLRELLAAELGVDPDPTTRALYEAIKTKDSLPAG